MSNPHVVKLQQELTGILERAFDRTVRAINDSRSGTYTGTQLYQDATDAFVDGVYGTFLPFLEFLPFRFDPQPPLPEAAFELTTSKSDDVTSIPLVPPDATSKVTTVDWTDLTLTGTTATIPKKYVDVQIAGDDLVVKVKATGIPSGTKLGTYVGDVVATNLTGNPTIARVRVRWFVI